MLLAVQGIHALLTVCSACFQVALLLADGFQRLLAHGIAQFHGFRSASRLAGSERDAVSPRRP